MPIDVTQFETVSNDLRENIETTRRGKLKDVIERLKKDETLFIPKNGVSENALNKFYGIASNSGFKFSKHKTTIKDVEGWMIWFERKEEAKNGN